MTDETRRPDADAGAEAEPEAGAATFDVLRCPRDRAVLVEATYEADIAVDECPKCQGRWLDHGELERIQETVERDHGRALSERTEWSNLAYDVARDMSEAALPCPECGEDMERQEYARTSQVVIDVCPECRGVWLDQGELERLEVFFERAHGETRLEIPWYVRLSLLFKGKKRR